MTLTRDRDREPQRTHRIYTHTSHDLSPGLSVTPVHALGGHLPLKVHRLGRPLYCFACFVTGSFDCESCDGRFLLGEEEGADDDADDDAPPPAAAAALPAA